MPTLYIVYLDPYHLGDRLFVQNMAQQFSRPQMGKPYFLIVHGSGEKVERTLESDGIFAERVDGVLQVSDPAHVRLVERAVRETNQDLVATLTDEVVSAVGIQGTDRDLLRMDEEGTITTGRTGWLDALIKQRVLPVISALVEDPGEGRAHEVRPVDAALALARALDGFTTHVAFFTKTAQPGLADATGTVDRATLDDLEGDPALPEPASVRRVVQEGVPVLLTSLKGLLSGEEPVGTRVAS